MKTYDSLERFEGGRQLNGMEDDGLIRTEEMSAAYWLGGGCVEVAAAVAVYLAMRNRRLYPIWPAAPVTATRIGSFCEEEEERPRHRCCAEQSSEQAEEEGRRKRRLDERCNMVKKEVNVTTVCRGD